MRANPDERSFEQLRRHYEAERRVSDRLRNSSRCERRYLYTSLYDQIVKLVLDHPGLARNQDARRQADAVSDQMKILRRFLKADTTFLEVGAGYCRLSFEVAKIVKKVYAVDVSEEMTRTPSQPENFELIISDGCSIPVPENSVDVVYSHQLMEHLHPDDALEQLGNIYAALAPNGIYVCITPNRLTGPHDISKYFDPVATGFHLKEYTNSELATMFGEAGFARVSGLLGANRFYFPTSLLPIKWVEAALISVNSRLKRRIADLLVMKQLLDIRIVARK